MHPVKTMMMENKLEVHKDKTLREATEIAYKVHQNHVLMYVDACKHNASTTMLHFVIMHYTHGGNICLLFCSPADGS